MLLGVYLAVLMLLGIAIYTDVRTRTIPNWLVGLVGVLGFLHLMVHLESAHLYALSFLIGILVWGGLFHARAIGGGDAKLIMVLSLFVLPAGLVSFYLCVTIVGGLQALVALIFKQRKDLPYGVAIGVGSVLWFLLTNF